MKRVLALALLVLLLTTGVAEAYVLSISRAKIELVRAIRESYTPAKGMGWACHQRTAHWVSCFIVWENEGGSRIFCGYGSVKAREGYLVTNWHLVRCHP